MQTLFDNPPTVAVPILPPLPEAKPKCPLLALMAGTPRPQPRRTPEEIAADRQKMRERSPAFREWCDAMEATRK